MLIHSAFYQFVHLSDPMAMATWLRTSCASITGSILVASEGINGTIAGPRFAVAEVEAQLQQHPLLQTIIFKHSECTTPPFAKMRVHVKAEIVQMGVTGVNAVDHQPHSLNPEQWAQWIQRDDVVVIDNRNEFEYQLGHFAGATNPNVSHFKDFPQYIEEQLPQWQAEGKTIAMYCTGGIRCDKTSAWLHEKGVSSVVLEGGILNYLKHKPSDTLFLGECFVFDNRIALDKQLCETQTTAQRVYRDEPDAQWRIARAERLLAAATQKKG